MSFKKADDQTFGRVRVRSVSIARSGDRMTVEAFDGNESEPLASVQAALLFRADDVSDSD